MYLSAGQCCGHNISKGPPQRPRIIFVFQIPDRRIYLAILFGYFILSSLCLAILSGCSVGLPCLVALLGCPVWSPCWVALSGRPVLLPCWVTLPDSFFASPVRAAASFWRHSIFAQPPERYRLDRFPEHKKWLRHFYLCPSGEGISYKVKKNPANRILRLRGGRGSDMLPLRRSAIIVFSPYGKFGELSYMDSGVKRSSRQCRLADDTKEYCASGFCTMERRL